MHTRAAANRVLNAISHLELLAVTPTVKLGTEVADKPSRHEDFPSSALVIAVVRT